MNNTNDNNVITSNISQSPNNIEFQIIDWRYHEQENNDLEEGQFIESEKQYVIDMYGRTTDNKTIYISVTDYTPFFYVEIPNVWKNNHIALFIQILKKMVYYKIKDSLKEYSCVKRCRFRGFTNYKKFQFIRLVFKNYEGFRSYERALKKPIYDKRLSKGPKKYKLYESNIEPFFRCMHIRDLNACGWASIDKNKYEVIEDAPTICDYNIQTEWSNLNKVDKTEISPIVVAAFDIECTSGDGSFPQAERDSDKVIQIGTTFSRYGETECFYKHIVTLKSCDPIPGADVESYENERDVLVSWTRMIKKMNPDIITGYNIFGFDYKYLYNRSKKLGCYHQFSKLCRTTSGISRFVEKELKSAALGDNILYYYDMKGRVPIDLMKVIMKDHKLESYKLDYVASYFIREDILKIDIAENDLDITASEELDDYISIIHTKSTYGLKENQYISIYYDDGLSDNKYNDGKKYFIIALTDNTITVSGKLDGEEMDVTRFRSYWCQAKDDVSPQDIFKLQEGSSKDRAKIARYCLQDCVLCNKLVAKLQIITNNVGMANVCHVPLSYLFLRGQGVKIFSLVSKKCRTENFLLPVVKKPYKPPEDAPPKPLTKLEEEMKKMGFNMDDENKEEEEEGYEGATVFPPDVGVHFEPVPVLDYASLYPRSMIHRNLSHEYLVDDPIYDNLPGYIYRNVIHTNKSGKPVICRFAQSEDGSHGIIPMILQDLLDARSRTKAEMKKEKDPFKKSILDGLQLAYKITANSLYGQIGAGTSPIFLKEIAASTTATGREMLTLAKEFNETIFLLLTNLVLDKKFKTYRTKFNDLCDGKILDFDISDDYKKLLTDAPDLVVAVKDERFVDKKLGHTCRKDFIDYFKKEIKDILGDYRIKPKVIYGDTDSVFLNFYMYDPVTDEVKNDQEALEKGIKLGVLCGLVINKFMPYPHDLEYEKTFWPFCILTKKRYVGNKFEFNPNSYEQNSMGIVLKRRDNAKIVKIVCGGIVRSILRDKSPRKAVEFTKDGLYDILCEKYPMDKFIITKTLRGEYKDRTRIPHAILADRMGERDPGNKPQSNDRIPYAFIPVKKTVKLQGERIEHPDYIINNNLKLDYLYYITNQIMKPCVQFLALLVKKPDQIFNEFIIMEENRRKGKRPTSYYFDKDDGNMSGIKLDDDFDNIISTSGIKQKSAKKSAKKSTKKSTDDAQKSNKKSVKAREIKRKDLDSLDFVEYDEDKGGFTVTL